MAEVRQRFLREAKSAGRLNHPNIVTIFDVGEQDGVAYMAMELLEGRSLQQILSESARLPFQTIADLVAQIADALDRAQQLGIVHRDVKPANVVVSASGHAKLTDFGVALRAGLDDDADRHHDRLAPLHVAGAGAWPADRSALRHFLARGGALRDAGRARAIRSCPRTARSSR